MPTGVNELCEFLAKSGDPDQTSRYAAPDLGQRWLPLSNKKDTRFIWVNIVIATE